MPSQQALEITNLYLYGSTQTPGSLASGSVITGSERNNYQIDMSDYMSTGAGRFALASRFEIVQSFFGTAGAGLAPGSYTKDDLKTALNLGSSLFLAIQQINHKEPGESDESYLDRIYLFNSGTFTINDDARFIVEADGTRRIEHLKVEPFSFVGSSSDTVPEDNFDFESSGPSQILATASGLIVDPSAIGAQVTLEFTDGVPERTYDLSDFLADQQTESSWVWGAPTAIEAGPAYLRALYEAGVTRFVDEDDRAIQYGSLGDDQIVTSRFHYLEALDLFNLSPALAHRVNGQSIFTALGDDVITVDDAPEGATFYIDGGAGVDVVDLSLSDYGWVQGRPVTIGGYGLYEGLDVELFDVEHVLGTDRADVLVVGENNPLTFTGNGGADSINYSFLSTPGNGVDVALAGGADVAAWRLTGLGDTISIFDVEEVTLGAGDDTVVVRPSALGANGGGIVVDAAGNAADGGDTLDLSQLGDTVYNNGRIAGSSASFRNFEILNFGDGVDRIRSNTAGATIYLGDGNDVLLTAATGTQVYGGGGADRFHLHDNVRIMDASAEDRISYAGILNLTGGLREATSDSQYAMHITGAVGYAMNGDGDLVIHDFIRNRNMFIANYQSELNGGVDTAGIHVADYWSGAFFAVEDKPSHMTDLNTWALVLGHFMKANLGVSLWEGVDPLVLDLDGDGLELTGLSSRGPVFDYDGDGYGERGGWVSRDDGLLVLDANSDGKVADVGELFGGPGLSGFAELAAHDLNADGVIDANDAVYGQLSVWRDLNQNRVVDAGEMLSLAAMGIASIGVGGTASNTSINGNAVTATGAFTRTDGTTGLVGDIGFRVNQQVTTWMGDRTISAAAAALPELKGFGTLTDLRVAMTLDPSLQTVVAAVLPTLDTLDLAVMRAAVLPLFTAWADASPITGTAPAGGHEDVTVLTQMIDGQRVMTDYAFHRFNVDTGQGEWVMAGSNLARPTLAALLLTASGDSPEWDVLEGAWIDFFERYMGETLPIGGATVTGAPAMGVQAIFSGLWNQVNLLTVRLAVQGPLAEYFEGVKYDVATDSFLPTTDRQLIPVFEAILAEAGTMSSGALDWLASWDAILDIVVGDYKQPEGVMNTNGFLFANIVAAYESTGLTLDIVAVSVALGLPAEVLRAGAGTLTGGNDADLFYLGAGDQTAIGGLGPDTYVMGRGFGHDVIIDIEPALTQHAEDVVRFADIASTEVTARREGLDLIISVNGTTDELRIVDHFDGRLPGIGGAGDLSSSTGVDFIRFADGVQWTPFDIARAVARHTAGADTLLGTETIDWLDGGAGNDFLSGGNDADVYVYGHGYGHDTISDLNGHIYLAGPDFVSFIDGITIEDLHFSRIGASDDLLITVAGQDGSLTLINQFAATYTGVFGVHWIDQIEGFLFDDGSSLDWLEVAGLLLQQASTSGNDTIYGFSLEDRIDGGAGDDFMSGGNENDTYVFGRGYGHDTIHEQWSNILSGGIDVVEFRPDTAPADVAFTRDGDDLIVTITATGDTLRIRDQYVVTETGTLGTHAFNQIEHFRFADGTVLNWPAIRTAIIEASQTPGDDLVLGTHFDDVFEGGEGDDRIEGGNGGDTYRFNVGDGADTIRDHLDNLFTDRADRVVFGEGISADDIVITRYGAENNSVRLAIGGTGDSVSIEQQFAYTTIALKEFEVERFEFHDGTVWTANDLRLHYLAQAQTAGDDTVIGFWTNDQIEGGTGNDILKGGDGSDTYVFNLGFGVDEVREWVDNVSYADNDAVVFGAGLLSTDAIFTRDGDDLTISFAGLPDQVTIFGQFETQAFYAGWRDIETFTFGDSVVLAAADIRVRVLAQASTSGDDVITGFSSVADVINGGAGNDILRGLGGGDVYLFGVGSGQDVIQESIGSLYEDQPDTLRFDATVDREDVTFTRDGADLVITVAGVTDSVRIEGQFGSTGYAAVERFEFHGGLVLTKAEVSLLVLAAQSTPGDDIIVGTGGADVIAGGAGNDILRGGDGADTYYFATGFGSDVIDEEVDNVAISDFDVIEFGPGLLAADAVLSRDGADLLISFPTGDVVRVLRQFDHMAYFAGWEDIEEIRFQAGEVWTQADIRERLLEQASTSGDDVILGYFGADVMDGGAGDDELHGLGGDDIYVFGFGSGHDTVIEAFEVYEGKFDTVAFKAGVLPADVVFTIVGDDLVATLTGGSDSLSIRDFFRSEQHEVEVFTFADGSSLNMAQVASMALAAQTTAGDDIIAGSWRADSLSGGRGDDRLSGGGGGDTYHYAVGDGRDIITDGGDSAGDVITLGAGITTTTINLYRSGPDLVIETVGGDQNAIVVRGHFQGTVNRIEGLVFADGTVWDVAAIAAHLEVLPAGELRGTFADDAVTGTAAAETLIGREGDDVLTGGAGSDVYVYESGDGSDTIVDSSTTASETDVLQLGDFAPGDVQMRRVGGDLIITVPGGVITVEDHFTQAGAGRGLERIDFAGGVSWNRADIDAAAWVVGTAGDDTLTVTAGDTVFQGGLGDDTLAGGAGSDTYVYASGDGSDRIQEGYFAGVDRLWLTDLNAADVMLSRVGNDLMVRDLTTNQVIKIDSHFEATGSAEGHGIESLRFGDGVIWDRAAITANSWTSGTTGVDNLGGTAGADNLFGDLGDDILQGGAGGDTYRYRSGDGSDRIQDSSTAGADVLHLVDLNASDVALSRVGADVYVKDLTTGHSIRINEQAAGGGAGNADGIEIIRFADGTEWNRATILANAWIRGTTGADNFGGFGGDDTMFGDLGADRMGGGVGADTYIYRSGDGADIIAEDSGVGADTLHLVDLNASDVAVSRVGSDLMILDLSTGQSIKVESHFFTGTTGNGYGVEVIRFADGTEWNRATILSNAWVRGTTGADNLGGSAGDDTMFGGLGADRLAGGVGADTYIYRSGDGADTIADDSNTGADTLHLVDLNPANVAVSRVGSDLMIQDLSTGHTIKVEYHFFTGTTGNGYGVEVIRFADGTEWNRAAIQANAWIRGTTGADTFGGTGGDDTMFGGLGADRIGGGAGADTYVYRSGDGADTIAEDSGVGADTLHLIDLNASNVAVSRVGSDLMIKDLSTGQSIKVEYHFWSGTTGNGYGIETLKFADGATWTRQQIADAVSGLSAIGLSAKAVVSPLAPPSPSESAGKDAGPLVQPSVSDDFGKGALDPIVCRTDPTEDFVVKSYDDGPLVRPVTDDFAVHGPIVRDMYDGWSLTLPIDWAGGVGVGPSTPHTDDDWLF